MSQITFYDSFLNNLKNSTLDAQQMHSRAPWTSRTLCIMAAPFCISTAMHECYSCSSSSPMLVTLDIFNFSHSSRWAVASHCIPLMINDLEPLFTWFLPFVHIFDETSINILFHFKKKTWVILLLGCEKFSLYSGYNLSAIHFKRIFSQPMDFFFLYSTVSFQNKFWRHQESAIN